MMLNLKMITKQRTSNPKCIKTKLINLFVICYYVNTSSKECYCSRSHIVSTKELLLYATNLSDTMDIIAKLQGQLECPICFSISQLRIFVCENGHKICEPCHGRLAAPGLCPQSRLELETKAIRRFEKIS